jgi:hypothetical protein
LKQRDDDGMDVPVSIDDFLGEAHGRLSQKREMGADNLSGDDIDRVIAPLNHARQMLRAREAGATEDTDGREESAVQNPRGRPRLQDLPELREKDVRRRGISRRFSGPSCRSFRPTVIPMRDYSITATLRGWHLGLVALCDYLATADLHRRWHIHSPAYFAGLAHQDLAALEGGTSEGNCLARGPQPLVGAALSRPRTIVMKNDAVSELFNLVHRVSEGSQDDMMHTIVARPSRRPLALSSPDWTRRPIQIQLADARAELEAAELEAALPGSDGRDHLSAACLFLAAAVLLRCEQRGKKT